MSDTPANALLTRGDWLAMLQRICAPVLAHGAAGTLKAAMPVDAPVGGAKRRAFAHLEACCRMLAGLAPWLELEGLAGEEAAVQAEARQQAQALLAAIVDPASPDWLDFGTGQQPLVEAGFLAQALLRAPRRLWNDLPGTVRDNLLRALGAARAIEPPASNWMLCSALVEAFLAMAGQDFDRARVDRIVRQFDRWYVGDGWYADGAAFRFDYYNSFVIHPFLIDIVRVVGGGADWTAIGRRHVVRARRHAVQLERMIAPDGTMPAIGRSLAYRCGNLHLLAQLALLRSLPIDAGQAREAMGRAIARSLSVSGSFDGAGWLTVGHAGYQPRLAEDYISTGSLYLCAVAFLPLGLPSTDPFWTAPAAPTTGDRLYAGDPAPDIAIDE